MRWTPEQLRDYEQRRQQNRPRAEIPHPKSECDQTPALGTAIQGEAQGVQCVTVKFVGYRVKPLDPDNFAGSVKDILDGLRHAGLISGDEPWRIRLETEQIKVAHYKDEQTIIEITTPST